MDHKEDLSTTEGIFVGLSNNNNVNDAAHMATTKGKRTKRLRLLSPCGGVAGAANTTVMTSSCSSASGGSGGGDDQGSLSISSTTTTDQEEEDMANCLILLAQGGGGGGGGGGDSHNHHHHHQQHLLQQVDHDQDHGDDGNNKIEIKGRKFSEMGTASAATNTTTNKVGFYIYECKTCNRTFPSFQALGGHRASHKKPKLMAEEKKPPPPAPSSPPSPPPPSRPQLMNTNYDHHQFELGGGGGQQPRIKSVPPVNPISLQFGSAHKANFNGNNNKAKIHECSICGSEFASGQALGGHMRRHRASTNTSTQPMSGIETTCNVTAAVADVVTVTVEVQPRNILELDLNLPAPEEDLREPKFQFTAATQKSMVLSAAPALVDCHY